jgi:nucleoside-diphosphate-sugar epimerase
MTDGRHFVVTGGAGYIGSSLSAALLAAGNRVTVLDSLLYGGEALLALRAFPGFRAVLCDVRTEDGLAEHMAGAHAVFHLAALVGFPICDRVGERETYSVNLDGTRNVYEAAARAEVPRLVYSSSYSNYGIAADDTLVTEDSPLHPQSTYASSKVAAERFLLDRPTGALPTVTCLRLATVFGVTPRMRFDLMLNQFALQVHNGETLVLYEQDYRRTFVHVSDVVRAMRLVVDADIEKVAGQVFNVGNETLNSSKRELVSLLREAWPTLRVENRAEGFGGDMRSVHVSFEKIRRTLSFQTRVDLRSGVRELHEALTSRWVHPADVDRYRNHPPLLS